MKLSFTNLKIYTYIYEGKCQTFKCSKREAITLDGVPSDPCQFYLTFDEIFKLFGIGVTDGLQIHCDSDVKAVIR